MIDRLIELVNPFVSSSACGLESGSCEFTDCRTCNAQDLANRLLANGVTVQEWISVKDRLPEKDERVLTYRPGQFYEMVVVSFDGYNWERWDTCGGTSEKLITHWMPLPQPPKGE